MVLQKTIFYLVKTYTPVIIAWGIHDMNIKPSLIALSLLTACSVLAESGQDISLRSQIRGELAGGGFQVLSSVENRWIGAGFGTNNGPNSFFANYAESRGKLFWLINGSSQFKGDTSGLNLYVENEVFSNESIGIAMIFGFDHFEPSANDAYLGVAFATPRENGVSLGATVQYIKVWDSGFEDGDIATDVSLSWKTIDQPKLMFDAGLAFKSDVTGDESYFVRASWTADKTKYRVKYSQGGRITFDVSLNF
ncbi:MAG: hypothetical protein KF836_08340 [Fimbriimonadaceae bacterium]|nr:hypothetical protein [Fimbriimonadaceae bacterium]